MQPAITSAPPAAALPASAAIRNGREIYANFRAGLADPSCASASGERWQTHFANAPKLLASRGSDALALFGYVVDALRAAHLPTEYALIPFVESGYKPGARNGAGPAGLWQFIAVTARNHDIPIRPGYDGRLSPVASTQAAVRYLKTLHGMFAGDWRLAVMAFNAGEYRVFAALKGSGQRAMQADPEKLSGLSGITQGYVKKLHALSCVLDRADDSDAWMRSLDRPVATLVPSTLPKDSTSLDSLASSRGIDADTLKRLNPALTDGRVTAATRMLPVLAPSAPSSAVDATFAAFAPAPAQPLSWQPSAPMPIATSTLPTSAPARTHTVVRGESLWTIAQRYGVSRNDIAAHNGLTARSVLRPGMVLGIDDAVSVPAPDLQAVAK